jgi:type I restriction enzyme S subunit
MTLETFFEKFDLFADAPCAVGKMRELVLHLAFSGKLLPAGEPWPLKPLKSLAVKIGSGATPAGGKESYFTEGIPLIRSMNVHFAGFEPKGLVFLSDEQAKQLANVTVQPSDVLLNITGASIGRVTTAPPEMAGARFNQHVSIIRPIKELDAQFLAKFLASPAIQRMINDIQVGATREALTKGMIEQFDIPLPPLAEQRRIVAKVDELMALCDRLEEQQLEREAQAGQLARASLTRFADAPTPANLNHLFHSSFPISPSDLRKSILTLAVQGKLVPRIESEGMGSDILEKAGVSAEHPDDVPDLPAHWVWACLGCIATRMDSGWSPACIPEPSEKGEWGVLKTTAVQALQYQEEQNKALPPNLEPRPEHEVMDGDILFTRAGPMNRVGILCVARPTRKKLIISDKIIRFHLVTGIDPDFAALSMNAGHSSSVVEGLKSGMAASQVNISQPKLRSVPIPLPPLAEQRRVVAKVSELMALVDELETQLAASRADAEKLLSALVAELTGTTSLLPADS